VFSAAPWLHPVARFITNISQEATSHVQALNAQKTPRTPPPCTTSSPSSRPFPPAAANPPECLSAAAPSDCLHLWCGTGAQPIPARPRQLAAPRKRRPVPAARTPPRRTLAGQPLGQQPARLLPRRARLHPLRDHRPRQLVRQPVALAVIFFARAVMIMKKKFMAFMKRIMRIYYYMVKNAVMADGVCTLAGVAEQRRPLHGAQPASSARRARGQATTWLPVPGIDDESVLSARLDAHVALDAQRAQVPAHRSAADTPQRHQLVQRQRRRVVAPCSVGQAADLDQGAKVGIGDLRMVSFLGGRMDVNPRRHHTRAGARTGDTSPDTHHALRPPPYFQVTGR
jgi:hypothetical protein